MQLVDYLCYRVGDQVVIVPHDTEPNGALTTALGMSPNPVHEHRSTADVVAVVFFVVEAQIEVPRIGNRTSSEIHIIYCRASCFVENGQGISTNCHARQYIL
jgi:hypothetical protein